MKYSTLANEFALLATPSLWHTYPLLLLTKLLMSLRTGGLLTYLLTLDLVLASIFDRTLINPTHIVWLALMCVPTWVVVSAWAAKVGRMRALVAYPVYLAMQPLFSLVVLAYSVATMRRREWSGRRAVDTLGL